MGFVEVRKDVKPPAHSDTWLQRTTPPDYRDRQHRLGIRRGLVRSADRVLLVDDWIDTGGQASGARALVEAAGARWLGAALLVDALSDSQVRRRVNVRSLLHVREL